MMQFLKGLTDNSHIRHYLSIDTSLNCLEKPTKLLKVLEKKSQQKAFMKYMIDNCKNHFKCMRILSICNLLVIYSDKFYEFLQNLPPLKCDNEWIQNNFVEPYVLFLKRCSNSEEMYSATKNTEFYFQAYDLMFYCAKSIKCLTNIVQKMPLLGRYYRPKNMIVVNFFVEVIALQAEKLYNVLKKQLSRIIGAPKKYIYNSSQEEIIKDILLNVLPYINEEMKKLFLDKYFYPVSKGIVIKLFKIEDQNKQDSKIIDGILTNHLETDRKHRMQELEQTLFPEDGSFNIKFYQQTLHQASLSFSKPKHITVDLEDIPEDFTTFKNQKVLPKTDSQFKKEEQHRI